VTVVAAALFIIGCIFGSFLNVVAYRAPRGRSIVHPPSACPACGARVRPWDNVPVLSFLLLRGRCRDCGARISPRYPVVELLGGAVPLLLWLRYGAGAELAILWPLSYVLIVLSVIDLDSRILPDRVTLPGIAVGLIVSPLLGMTTFVESLIGAVVGGGALLLVALLGDAVFRKESMGGGDIKLAAMLGAFLGWKLCLVLLFVAFFAGAVVGVATIAVRGRQWDRTVPFGPFIAFGAFSASLWGDALLRWYLSIFR